MKLKHSAILAMPFLLLMLTGCSGTKDSSSNSSSSSKSSQDDSYDLPTSDAFTKAVNKDKNMDTSERATAEENDANIRYSDIVGSSNRDKYAGKAKIVTGTVTGKKVQLRRIITCISFLIRLTRSMHIGSILTKKEFEPMIL